MSQGFTDAIIIRKNGTSRTTGNIFTSPKTQERNIAYRPEWNGTAMATERLRHVLYDKDPLSSA
ncbi:MAG: hypothetical protein LKG23_11205 [Nitrospira sp.]|nr:hypothetical protein [Nitrospira sp.]